MLTPRPPHLLRQQPQPMLMMLQQSKAAGRRGLHGTFRRLPRHPHPVEQMPRMTLSSSLLRLLAATCRHPRSCSRLIRTSPSSSPPSTSEGTYIALLPRDHRGTSPFSPSLPLHTPWFPGWTQATANERPGPPPVPGMTATPSWTLNCRLLSQSQSQLEYSGVRPTTSITPTNAAKLCRTYNFTPPVPLRNESVQLAACDIKMHARVVT